MTTHDNQASERTRAADSAESNGPFRTMVIQNVTVVDGSGSPAVGPMDIWIEGDRITRLSKSHGVGVVVGSEAPSELVADHVIDATGLYAVPGLIDAHMHIIDSVDAPRQEYWYKLLLACGITSVKTFDVGDMTPAEMVAEKHRIEESKEPAPRLWVYPIWGENADPAFIHRYADSSEAQRIVAEWAELGVDGVKIRERPGLYPDIFSQISAESAHRGLGLAVHIGQEGVSDLNAVQIAEAGATSIEHHYGYPESAFTDRTIQNLPANYVYTTEEDRFVQVAEAWQQLDRRKLFGEVIDRLLACSERGRFYMMPTFACYEKQQDPLRMKSLPWFSEFAPPGLKQHWWPNPRRHGQVLFDWTSTRETAYYRMFNIWMEFVNEYKNQGGKVGLGSDPFGSWYSLAGFYTIRELEMYQHAGFSPLEVLRSATHTNAQNLGADDLGLIRPGFLADILLLRENPLKDLKVFYPTGLERWDRSTGDKTIVAGIHSTIKAGVVYNTATLIDSIRSCVKRDLKRFPEPR